METRDSLLDLLGREDPPRRRDEVARRREPERGPDGERAVRVLDCEPEQEGQPGGRDTEVAADDLGEVLRVFGDGRAVALALHKDDGVRALVAARAREVDQRRGPAVRAGGPVERARGLLLVVVVADRDLLVPDVDVRLPPAEGGGRGDKS